MQVRRNALGSVWEGSKPRASVMLGTTLPSWHLCVTEYCQPETSPELQCPEFLMRLHSIGMMDSTQSLTPSPPQKLGRYHGAQSSNPLIPGLVFQGWPAPILSHPVSINYQGWSEGHTKNSKGTPITQEIPSA